MRVVAINRPELKPWEMPARFRRDIAYFMTPPGEHGAPPTLGAGEYWISLSDARGWLEAGVLTLVSPLDSENQAEAEITEEQEQWLEWMVANQVEHVRLDP